MQRKLHRSVTLTRKSRRTRRYESTSNPARPIPLIHWLGRSHLRATVLLDLDIQTAVGFGFAFCALSQETFGALLLLIDVNARANPFQPLGDGRFFLELRELGSHGRNRVELGN